MANYTLQLLHHADFEGTTNALNDAPELAAIVDFLDDFYVDNTLKLSGGDNWIPSPWYNAQESDQEALRAAVQAAYEEDLGLDAGTLSSLQISEGTVDQALVNLMGFQVSTLGNHEFDKGPDDVARIINPTITDGETATWGNVTNIGSYFPYITTNLDFSASTDLATSFSTTVKDADTYGLDAFSASATDVSDALIASGASTIAPATTVTVGGEVIGLVGATTQRLGVISSPGDVSVVGATDDDMDVLAAQIQTQVDALIAQGVNKVIAITHLQGYKNDVELAAKLSGVDIILTGGSDAIFADATDQLKPGDSANESTYPLEVVGADGNPVMLVSTDGQYHYLGRLVVEFDENGVVIPSSIDPAESGPIPTDAALIASAYGETDPYADGTMAGRVNEVVNAVDGIIGEKVENVAGYSDVFLNGLRSGVRNQETNLGNLTADANLAEAKAFLEANPEVVSDGYLVSMKNGGGIRAEIGLQLGVSGPEAPVDGEVNQLAIETTLAFNNKLVVYPTTLEGLIALLEHGLAEAGNTDGRFPQIAGMKVGFDPSAEAGSRLVSIDIVDDTGASTVSLLADGEAQVATDTSINIASLDFLVLNDGDDYPFSTYATGEIVALTEEDGGYDVEGYEQDALADYLAENHGTLDSAFSSEDTAVSQDARIFIVGAEGSTRVEYLDSNFALDLDGDAGTVAKLIGAVLGASSVSSSAIIGAGLDLVDQGVTGNALVRAALEAVGLSTTATEAVASQIYLNVYGTEAPSNWVDAFSTLAESGLGVETLVSAISESDENIENIGLGSMTSLEFI